jgi:hypothetical protein
MGRPEKNNDGVTVSQLRSVRGHSGVSVLHEAAPGSAIDQTRGGVMAVDLPDDRDNFGRPACKLLWKAAAFTQLPEKRRWAVKPLLFFCSHNTSCAMYLYASSQNRKEKLEK